MKRAFLKGSLLLLPVAMLIYLQACNKNDASSGEVPASNRATQKTIENMIRASGTDLSYTVYVNKTQTIQLYDKNRHLINLGRPELSSNSVGYREAAVWSCAKASEKTKPQPKATLTSISVHYSSEGNCKFRYQYSISSPFRLLESYDGEPSYGSAELNSANGAYTDDLPAIKVELLGDDPTNSSLYLYKITMTSAENIPGANVQSLNRITPNFWIYTDCIKQIQYQVIDQTGYDPQNFLSPESPTDRVDKCFINPQNPAMGFPTFNVNGCYVSARPLPPYYTLPQYHEIQYRKAGVGEFVAAPIYSSIPGLLMGTIGRSEVSWFNTSVPTGTYEIRYRNKMKNPIGNVWVTGPWQVETWDAK